MTSLYISDLDGTLLRNDARLSQLTKSTLQRLIESGLIFTVASARNVVAIQELMLGLDLKLPVINFNGAFISDLHSGYHHIINAIEPGVGESIFAILSGRSKNVFVSTFDGSKDRLYYNAPTNDGERWYLEERRENNDKRIFQTDNLANSLKEAVVCLTVIGEFELLGDLELELREAYGNHVEIHFFENAYSPGWHWLTIHDKRATKDQAIQILMDSYGLNDNELIVFGDHINDVKMFKIAAHSVAVSNAHAEAKRHARQVIGSNEDDSVAKFIEDHFLQRNGRESIVPE